MIRQSKRNSDLGGIRAISWTPYAVMAPTTIISVILLKPHNFTLSEITGWFGASAVGYSVFCLILFLAHLSFFKNRANSPVPVWSVFALGLIAGVVKGATTGYVSFIFELDAPVEQAVASRMVNAGILGLLAVPSAALIMSSIDRFHAQRLELIAEQMQNETKRMFNENMIPALQAQLRERVTKNLSAMTDSLKAAMTKDQSTNAVWKEIALDLRESAETLVRSVSHNLWSQQPTAFPDLTFVGVARSMVSTNPFPFVFILPVLALSVIPSNLSDHGLAELAPRVLAVVLGVYATLVITKALMDLARTGKALIYFSGIIIASLVPIFVGVIYFNDQINQKLLGLTVAFMIWLISLVITCGLVVATLRQRREILDELEMQIDGTRIQALATEQMVMRLSKDMAKYLHGNLQSRMMATAFAIETAGSSSNLIELDIQLENARRVIETPFDHFFESEPEELQIEISNLTRTWEGLLETRLVISGGTDLLSPVESRAILLCVEEGLANALRHGQASEVQIKISIKPSEHMVSLIDNGIGPRPGIPGLGSSLFNSFAGTNWSLTRGPDGVGSELKIDCFGL